MWSCTKPGSAEIIDEELHNKKRARAFSTEFENFCTGQVEGSDDDMQSHAAHSGMSISESKHSQDSFKPDNSVESGSNHMGILRSNEIEDINRGEERKNLRIQSQSYRSRGANLLAAQDDHTVPPIKSIE